MLLKEAEQKFNIKFPKLFRKAYRIGVIDWLNCDGRQFPKIIHELEKRKDTVICEFYIRFIPFAQIENAIAVFIESLENNSDYNCGAARLNPQYEYIPFAKVGSDSRDYYMFVYDKKNPSAEPMIAVYHTHEVVMYICAANFGDLVFRELAWKVKNDGRRKCGVNLDVIEAYSMFLSGERKELALSCVGGNYAALLKEYEDFLLTEDGIILDKQVFFPHLIADDEVDFCIESAESVYPRKLIIDGRIQKISVDFDEIRYIEADDKSCCIRLKRSSVNCNRPFSYIESLLPQDRFFRCHRSFIVGFKHIITHSDSSIIFDNGEKAIVSRRLYSEFKKRFGEYSAKYSTLY
jgi:hypothetical protein